MINPGVREELITELIKYTNDPLRFVHFAYPWGVPGSPLADSEGPNHFQLQVLTAIRDGLKTGEPVLISVTSGHGVGKSALMGQIADWAQSTFEDTKGVVTANTEVQLRTKTWAELNKWCRMSVTAPLFKVTATARLSVDPRHTATWRLDMVPWSERNTEAFAGMHNKDKRVVILMDEGSAIPDIIWEVVEGALTDASTQIIWCVFGNPTRSAGRFRECFEGGKFAHRWHSIKVDSRSVPQTNKRLLENWIEDYGIDSDFVRVRVLGEFPRIDSDSFISLALAQNAANRDDVYVPRGTPVVLGVDVARFGGDASVIYPRRGRDGFSLPVEIYPYMDTMTLASKVAEAFYRHKASFVFVDGGGVGGGVVDRLHQMHIPVVDVQFGARPDGTSQRVRGVRYANKRAEIWGDLRDWLEVGKIPNTIRGLDKPFPTELSVPLYGFNASDALQLESKKDIRRRGQESPNVADALALTFAFATEMPDEELEGSVAEQPYTAPDYNPFEMQRILN